MRKEEKVDIQIDEKTTKTFKVFEVRPRDLFDAIFNSGAGLEASFADLIGPGILPLLTTATMQDLKELYPSDVEKIYEALKRVNAPLLRGLQAARKVDLGPALEIIKASIINDLVAFAADLLPLAMSTASITAGASLSPPSRKPKSAKKGG